MLAIAAFAPVEQAASTAADGILVGAGALGTRGRRARRAARRRRARAARTERQLADFHPGARPRDRAGRRPPRRSSPPPPGSRAATSRCCAGSPSPSCSPAWPSSTTRSSRRWAPENVHLGDLLRVAAWAVLFAGVLGEMRGPRPPARRRPRSSASAAASPASCTTASRRNSPSSAGAPAAWPSCPTASRSSTPSSARSRIRAARSRRSSRLPTSRCDVALERLGARLATECGVEVQVNVRVATELARRRPRRARPDHLRGRPQRGQPRRRAPRARRSRRARRWPSAIIDDGNGFRDGANSGLGVAGYGLIAMRERAEQVGGQFSLESVRGAGTLVQVVLP